VRGKSKYVIPFKGLKTGQHIFEFDINKEFFEPFSNVEINEASCRVEVELNKQTRILELSIHIKGYVKIRCDRCLEYFQLSRDILETLYVKFSDTEVVESDNIIIIPEKEHELDLTQIIYEYIMLSLTYESKHPEDKDGISTCDPEIIKYLDEYSRGKENKQDTDPRWNQLKSLINKQ
jgi:uncharacterized protein